MNKKLNSVIYILVATVVNLLLLMTFMALAMGVFALLVHLVPSIAESSMAMVIMMLLIVASLFGSFFVYSRLARWVIIRFDLESKLDPLFGKGRRRARREE